MQLKRTTREEGRGENEGGGRATELTGECACELSEVEWRGTRGESISMRRGEQSASCWLGAGYWNGGK